MEHDVVMLKKMATYKHPWIIDIWSLGCIVLEIVSGIPLWMSVKTRTPDKQTSAGLFAVKNRLFTKIIQKQI
jgi:dual specificity tyrosine-phosphorylation-regulated kinase 2/3/4